MTACQYGPKESKIAQEIVFGLPVNMTSYTNLPFDFECED